jgi:hypothetical protein
MDISYKNFIKEASTFFQFSCKSNFRNIVELPNLPVFFAVENPLNVSLHLQEKDNFVVAFSPDYQHVLPLLFYCERVITNVVFLLPLPAALAELTSSSPS